MSITKTPDTRFETIYNFQSLLARGSNVEVGEITFDSSYPLGGESVTFSLGTPDFLQLENSSKYKFEYDSTNGKIKAFTGAKPLVVEESVTVASNAGTLKHKPLYIVAVHVTAGTTTGAFNVIPTGETPLTKQVAVTFTSGALKFLAGDAVTAVSVTYIPQHETGPLSADSLVVDETVAASASKTALASRAIAVQYVWDDTDGVIDGLEPVGEAPSATHKVVVDITNGDSTTDIDAHADDAANSLKVTYLKYSAFQAIQAISDADVTVTSEEQEFTADNGYRALVVPGFGTQLVGETGADGNVQVTFEGPSGTAAAGVATWNPNTNKIDTDESTAIATLAMPFFVLDPLLMPDSALEVPVGTNMSAVSVGYYAVKV